MTEISIINIYYYDYFTKGMYHELRDGILYDFKEPLNGYFSELCVVSESNQFECLDGMHNNHRLSYLHPDGIEFEMVEGIGYLRLSDEYDTKCDLFGLAYSNIPSLPDWCYYPYLYGVAKADGTVIYRDLPQSRLGLQDGRLLLLLYQTVKSL